MSRIRSKSAGEPDCALDVSSQPFPCRSDLRRLNPSKYPDKDPELTFRSKGRYHSVKLSSIAKIVVLATKPKRAAPKAKVRRDRCFSGGPGGVEGGDRPDQRSESCQTGLGVLCAEASACYGRYTVLFVSRATDLILSPCWPYRL